MRAPLRELLAKPIQPALLQWVDHQFFARVKHGKCCLAFSNTTGTKTLNSRREKEAKLNSGTFSYSYMSGGRQFGAREGEGVRVAAVVAGLVIGSLSKELPVLSKASSF